MEPVQDAVSVIRSQKAQWASDISEGQKRLQEASEENMKLQQQLLALSGAIQACDVLLSKLEAESASA